MTPATVHIQFLSAMSYIFSVFTPFEFREITSDGHFEVQRKEYVETKMVKGGRYDVIEYRSERFVQRC